METPVREIMLFGTEEPVAVPILLKAGLLTAEMEDGNLRFVRFDGREMVRAVSFIVRYRNWGTYLPRISNLRVDQARVVVLPAGLVLLGAPVVVHCDDLLPDAGRAGGADAGREVEGGLAAVAAHLEHRPGRRVRLGDLAQGQSLGLRHEPGRRLRRLP